MLFHLFFPFKINLIDLQKYPGSSDVNLFSISDKVKHLKCFGSRVEFSDKYENNHKVVICSRI